MNQKLTILKIKSNDKTIIYYKDEIRIILKIISLTSLLSALIYLTVKKLKLLETISFKDCATTGNMSLLDEVLVDIAHSKVHLHLVSLIFF